MTERVGVMALVAEARAGIEEISAEEAMPLMDSERSFWSTSGHRERQRNSHPGQLPPLGVCSSSGSTRARTSRRSSAPANASSSTARSTGARSCRRTPPGVWPPSQASVAG